MSVCLTLWNLIGAQVDGGPSVLCNASPGSGGAFRCQCIADRSDPKADHKSFAATGSVGQRFDGYVP